MVRLAQVVLAIALLSGPAYAADKVALVCSGTATLEDGVPHPLTGQTLTVDLEHKTVSGFLGHLAVIGASPTYISLRGLGEESDLMGFIRPYSGVTLLASPKRSYDLNCQPAKPHA
jgi:hypothetical protein